MIRFHFSSSHGVNANLENALRGNRSFTDIQLNYERFDEKSYKT